MSRHVVARNATTAILVATAIVAAACGDDVTAATSANVSGMYSLSAVNGSALPASVTYNYTEGGAAASDKTTWSSGSLDIKSDNSFTAIFNQSWVTTGANASSASGTDTTTGTWSLSGSDLTIISNEMGGTKDTIKGTWADNVLTVTAVDTVKNNAVIQYVSSISLKFVKQ